MTATAMNDLDAISRSIECMKEARDTHEKWAVHLRAGGCVCCTDDVRKNVGDVEHHQKWVENYDLVLSILQARRNSLRSSLRRKQKKG